MADQISNRKLGKQQEYNIDIITTEEIRKAIKEAKNNKVSGPDTLEGELFKYLEKDAMDTLQLIINQWWNDGEQHDNI